MIVNQNLLLYSKEYEGLTPLYMQGSYFRHYYTDYLIQTGEEFIVADLGFFFYGSNNYWAGTISCQNNDVGWSIGHDFLPVDTYVRQGGVMCLPSTRLRVEYTIRPPVQQRPGKRILWTIDNTGLIGAYETSGNWKKENSLGSNTLSEPLDWTSLIGQPIMIYHSGTVGEAYSYYLFYGLRIYNNVQDKRLLAEYIPFGETSNQYGKLLNTVNGQIIDPIVTQP